MWRVVMLHHDDEWEMFVHDTLIRYIPEKDLPDEIRMKLAMVMAHKANIPEYHSYASSSTMEVYKNTYPPEFNDIGWRYSKKLYVVVISLGCLKALQGDEIRHDSRR